MLEIKKIKMQIYALAITILCPIKVKLRKTFGSLNLILSKNDGIALYDI
jgi:hypothetical protein